MENACNYNLLTLQSYETIVENLSLIEDLNILQEFKKFNGDWFASFEHYEEIVILVSKIKNLDFMVKCEFLPFFPKNIEQSEQYLSILNHVVQVDNLEFLEVLYTILRHSNFCATGFKNDIRALILSTTDVNVLKNIYYLIDCREIMQRLNTRSIAVYQNLVHYPNLNLECILGYISIFENEKDKLIQQLNDILAIGNEEIVIAAINELEIELENLIKAKHQVSLGEEKISNNSVIEKYKLANFLCEEKGRYIKEMLGQLPDDEEINSKTFIKLN